MVDDEARKYQKKLNWCDRASASANANSSGFFLRDVQTGKMIEIVYNSSWLDWLVQRALVRNAIVNDRIEWVIAATCV